MSPRIEALGLTSVMESIPKSRVPNSPRYDIEFGYVISHETGKQIKIRL